MVRQRHAASKPLSPITETDKDQKRRKARRGNISNGAVTKKTVLFAASALAAILLLTRYGPRIHYIKNDMPGYVMKTSPRAFTPVPEGNRKTFWFDGGKISFPMVRALRSAGFQKVNQMEDAQIVFQYRSNNLYDKLKPWQRLNHIPGYRHWNRKDTILDGFKAYQERTGSDLYFLPESYRLEQGQEEFKRRILDEGGIHLPWVLKEPDVNQGKGIEMIAPNSERLEEVATSELDEDYIIQRYVCNELTWNTRKFDVRMFWFVASVDPLIVLYHDGYSRIGNGDYSENDFKDTTSHLTTHTGLGEEIKDTFQEFEKRLLQHYRSSPNLRHIRDPVQHVRNQFKDSLGEFIDAFKDLSFTHPGKDVMTSENAYGFYGADFILDKDLDVWFLEPQKGCGMDEDYKFRVEMHDALFGGMVSTLEEIWHKQEAGEPVLPLENTGGWEIIYGDGWRFKYEGYERSKNKAGCDNTSRKRRRVGRM
jgi:hypothetical protein